MKRIVPIYKSTLYPNTTAPLRYVPKNKSTRAVGVLVSTNSEVSLALKGGTHLVFNKQNVGKSTRTSPDSRIIPISERLSGETIVGKVKNITTEKSASKVSIYLIIEE